LLRVGDLVNLALDCLFPKQCVGCGRVGSFICPECAAHLPCLLPPICPRCGQPQASGILCPTCAGRTSSVLAIRSAFRFEGTIRAAIHELKYRNVRSLAPTLADYVTPLVHEVEYDPELVLPVPMHKSRLRKRGYNQASLLAISIGQSLALPVCTDVLTRIKAGPSQVMSGSGEARWSSVQGAYLCTNATVSDKRVLLVDDVCTTGATIEACGGALRAAGAAEVVAVTVAREV